METPEPDLQRRKIREKDIFEPYAPPYNLPFPESARFTAYELVAFLPNSIRCHDVVYRFVSNGATRRAIWALINSARDLQKEWTANQCGMAITKVMNHAGFTGWTTTLHDYWHAPRKDSWDETHLDVDGFATPGEPSERDEPSIQFKDLAISVRRWPQGDEALDLTRMVEYCVLNPAEDWTYPHDYEKLMKHIGGPRAVGRGNIDRVLFKSWEDTKPPPPRLWSTEEQETAKALLETKRRKKKGDNMRLETPISETRSRDATPTARVQRKERGRPRKRVKLEDIDVEELMHGEDGREAHAEHYTRAAAKYVAPPGEVTTPTVFELRLAFAAEHDVGETDLFSAYAFGGPRHQAPYRMLHDIDQPDEGDVSGWAENLRWSFEQRACFWHTVQVAGWNESPAHMEFIAQTRQKQVWASDELLEQLLYDGEEDGGHAGLVLS